MFGSDNICLLIDMFRIIHFIYSDIYYLYCSSFFLHVPRFLLALFLSLWRITFNNYSTGDLPVTHFLLVFNWENLHFILSFFNFLSILGFELRSSCLLGRYCTTWDMLLVLFDFGIFQVGSDIFTMGQPCLRIFLFIPSYNCNYRHMPPHQVY
jgi:hypothetical protein